MKKTFILSILLILIFALVFTGCQANEPSQNETSEEESITIKVGASPVPHAQILEQVKPILEEENINLEIIEFTDYIQPNIALADGDLDYNFFQHLIYLESFAVEHELDIIGGVKVHIEPMGLYSNSITSVDELQEGATIAIPNDPTNGGRALILLENYGLIELKEGAGLKATDKDIITNKKNLKFSSLEAAQLPRVIDDVDAAVINTNYALEANLSPTEDAIIIEDEDSPYPNLIAVRKGEENSEITIALESALTSDTVKEYIQNELQGIIPAF
jgi:D-methionine transport system substrate-binding protein